MKKLVVKILFLSAIMIGVLSCGKSSIDNPAEYFAYLEDEDNGIAKIREIKDVEIKSKYLPAEYLCYQEMKVFSDQPKERVLENYKYNLTFMVTIGPSKAAEQDFDITKVGVSNYEEFKERGMLLNFEMKKYFKLETAQGEYEPVFCEMENVYGLSYDRKFNVVFSPKSSKDELLNLEEFTLVYQDELFNTGFNKFKYYREDINAVPAIEFWNK